MSPMSPEHEETIVTEHPRPTSGRHPVSIGHLVMGLAFVGLVAIWALVRGDLVDGHDVRWLLPLPWVVAGAAGLLATTLTSRQRWGSRQTGWVGTPQHQTGWVVPPGQPADAPDLTTDPTTPESTDVPEEDR